MKCCINGENLISYQQSYSSLKSKNVVKFCVHISPIFSCSVTYTILCDAAITGKTPLYSGVRLYDEQDPPLN